MALDEDNDDDDDEAAAVAPLTPIPSAAGHPLVAALDEDEAAAVALLTPLAAGLAGPPPVAALDDDEAAAAVPPLGPLPAGLQLVAALAIPPPPLPPPMGEPPLEPPTGPPPEPAPEPPPRPQPPGLRTGRQAVHSKTMRWGAFTIIYRPFTFGRDGRVANPA